MYDSVAPEANVTLDTATPTDASTIHFTIHFTETPAQALTAANLVFTGTLAAQAVVELEGAGLDYSVAASIPAANDDGTLGLRVTGVSDAAGNACADAESPECTIRNWFGFLVEPQDAVIYSGVAHTFSVLPNCGNSTPTYQWYWRTDAKTLTAVGENAEDYIIANAGPVNSGVYYCEVTYADGIFTSREAKLDIFDHLLITKAPESVTKSEGQSHTFTVETTGGVPPVSYQWKKDDDIIEGATNAAYTIESLLPEHEGRYTVEVVDAADDALVTEPATIVLAIALPQGWMSLFGIMLGSIAFALYRRRVRN
jgi:hypothetical protein